MEIVDEEAAEGHLDSLTGDEEAAESPATDRLVSVESREEDVCRAAAGREEVREEAAPSAGRSSSFPFEELWDGEREEAAPGDGGAADGGSGSAAGEDGGDVWDNPFFSEECEDRDSWLPIGVVLWLLLKVSLSLSARHRVGG